MRKILIVSNSSWNIYNFRLILINKLLKNNKIIISCPNDKFTNKFKNLDLKFIPINYSRKSLNIFENLKIIYKYFLIIKKEKPNIILLYTIKPNIFVSLAVFLSFKNIKVFNFITGIGNLYFSNYFKKLFLLILYKIAFIKSEKIIFQNNEDINYFVSRKITSQKKCINISGSGIDSEFFKFHKLPFRNIHHLKFLCLSRIIEHKGIIEYFNAAKMIKTKYPMSSFILVGSLDKDYPKKFDAKYLDEFKNYVEIIEFTENILEKLKNCDCFILPSYREGTSRSILEAASVGRPIITTDVPGCNNIVKNNYNGYLCKPKDTKSLYETIEKMLNTDFETRNKMSINCRKIILNNFESNIINKKIINLLNQ